MASRNSFSYIWWFTSLQGPQNILLNSFAQLINLSTCTHVNKRQLLSIFADLFRCEVCTDFMSMTSEDFDDFAQKLPCSSNPLQV